MKVSYEEAADNKLIVPMKVIVRKVVMDINPVSAYSGQEKQRYGIWQNSYRNRLILKDAIKYAAKKKQTMITTYALEHLLYIKREFDLMKEEGLVPANVELVCAYREHQDKSEWNSVRRKMSRKHKNVADVFEKLPFMTLK